MLSRPRLAAPPDSGSLVVELSTEEWRSLSSRQAQQAALERALADVPGDDLGISLRRVAARLPVPLSVETVAIRLRDDADGLLHLVAYEGAPSRDRRRLALDALTVGRARSIFALGSHHSLARELGLRWLAGEWIRIGREAIGTIVVGNRTERRPSEEERALLSSVARELGGRLRGVDRAPGTLRSSSLRLAREAILRPPEDPESVLAALRPRERTILDLYTDGLSAQEIAELLVISPHTVRTHIKHAFRRLGVHSRDEASELVHEDQVLRLI